VDDNTKGIGNVRLDGPIRKVHATLQNATGEPRQSLLHRIGMNGAKRPGMAGIQELQEIVRQLNFGCVFDDKDAFFLRDEFSENR